MYARVIEMAGIETVVEIISDDAFAKILPPLDAEFRAVEDGMVLKAQMIDGSWTEPPAPEPNPDIPETAPIDPPATYRGLTYVEYISHAQIHGGMTDEQAVEILDTSVDPSIVLIRLKLEMAESLIYPDNPIVLGGLDTLVSKAFITAAGKTAILDNWPTV